MGGAQLGLRAIPAIADVVGYRLREGVTFCRVVDRFVFLDIIQDRYFCLTETADQAFGRLVSTGALPPGEKHALLALRKSGLLVEVTADARPEPCPGPREPRISLLDRNRPASALQTGLMLAHRLAAARQVGRIPLAKLLARLTERKAQTVVSARLAVQAAAIAAAFQTAALYSSAHDQCLAASIAVMRRLLASGVPADLVLGVKLRPFQAHCWVQLEERVVNDRVDTVAMFTPIFVL